MSFCNFPALNEQNGSLAARAMRTSFKQKMRDTFYIFAGSVLYFSPDRGFCLNSDSFMGVKFGLIDYPLFFLKISIYGLLKLIEVGINDAMNGVSAPDGYIPNEARRARGFALVIVAGLLFVALSAAHFIIAGLFTLLSTPFVAIAHAISRYRGSQLKDVLLENDKVNQGFDNDKDLKLMEIEVKDIKYKIIDKLKYQHQSCKSLLEKILENDSQISINAIRFSQLSNGEKAKVIFLKDNESYRKTYLLFRDTQEGRAAFDAFKRLNIANYNKFVTEHEVLGENSSIQISSIAQDTKTIFTSLIGLSPLKEDNSKLPRFPIEIIESIAAFTCHGLGDDIRESQKTATNFTAQLGWKDEKKVPDSSNSTVYQSAAIAKM